MIIAKHHSILLFLLLLFLLNACGKSTSTRDGPPRRAVDLSNVRDAVPRKERFSRTANPSSYVVFGKRYYVMQTNRNYYRRGIASWYGTKFHGRPTSTGERYNMYEMTAAHKTLKIPCFVRIKNLENGKTAIVRVNDRGPFKDNRIIDLSYAAAYKLDMLKKGTAFVEIQVLQPGQERPTFARRDESPYSVDAPKEEKYLPLVSRLPAFKTVRPIESPDLDTPPARSPKQRQAEYHLNPKAKERINIIPEPPMQSQPPKVASIAPTKNSRYAAPATPSRGIASKLQAYIQVGAFRNRRNAKRLYTRLWNLSYPFLQIHRSVSRGRALYRVRIGPIKTVKQLDLIANDLEKNGFRMTRVIVK